MPPRLAKCYYETLGVERDAGDDELKKQYRRLALRLHPDKNPDNVEEATEQFRLVQQAYEVLSDPQERAWYDKHRDAILKGGCGFGDNYQDDCLDLIPYFTAACYSGFKDDDNGFFAVYRQVFETLSKEEYEFAETEDELPQFGKSESCEEEFMSFYNHWQSFCTCRPYAWKDEYDIREAPNRRIRRLMEADNKKLRDAAKKERNEEVRELVAFVKKRDPRVKAYRKRLEEKAEEVKRRTEERRKQDIKERQKILENYKESEWSANSVIENDLQQLEANLALEFNDHDSFSSDEEDDFDDLYCIACDKNFKTAKARANHENSKKHKENMEALKQEMEEDDLKHFEDDLGLEEDGVEVDTLKHLDESTEGLLVEEDEDEDADEARDQLGKLSKLSKKDKKRRKQQARVPEVDAHEVDGYHGDQTDEKVVQDNGEEISETNTTNKKKKKNRRRAERDVTDDVDAESKTDDVIDDVTNGISQANLSDDGTGGTEETECKSKSKKKNKKPSSESESNANPSPVCAVCSQKFGSRSKLFDHLKESGHAVAPDAVKSRTQANTDKKSKKKSKR